MPRTAPAPNMVAIPGMNPGTLVAGGGGDGGGGGKEAPDPSENESQENRGLTLSCAEGWAMKNCDRMRDLVWLGWLLLFATYPPLVSCGGTQTDDGTGSEGGAATIGGGSGDSTGGSSNDPSELATPCPGPCGDEGERPQPLPRPRCPESEPALGGPCDSNDLVCGYGDALTPHCRTYYQCTEDAGDLIWAASTPFDEQAWPCLELPSDYCPADVPTEGDACTIEAPGIPCGYGNVSCLCSGRNPAPGNSGTWQCYGAPRNTACPTTLPNIGEGCSEEQWGIQCNYTIPTTGYCAPPHSTVFCYQGEWEPGEDIACVL
jgi:hypothetical protein